VVISHDVGDFGAELPRNRTSHGRTHALRATTASGIQAKLGSLLLRRDDFSAHVCARVACPTPAITTATRRILSSTYRINDEIGGLTATCNPLAIFETATSVS